MPKELPTSEYGVIQRNVFESDLDEIAEQIRRIGFCILESGYSTQELDQIATEFDWTREKYVATYGEEQLKRAREYHTVRALLTHSTNFFLRLAMLPNLLNVLDRLITGKYILNQQNGVVNPAHEPYNQGAWHRDLPYQHFVSNTPLAINALFCIDDFTSDNGATFVLPASHKAAAFPSPKYVGRNAIQIEAKRGQFIVMDCMLFHAGGSNTTGASRRGVNQMYTIPYFRQQINIPASISSADLSLKEKELLGFPYQTPNSVSEYLTLRGYKNS
ncbi:phytanoyl-CoA dioxygenase family protein [Achromobacter aloeverae]